MKEYVILINGVRLPYHVFEHVYKIADPGSEITVIFLFQPDEKMENYIFPSDIEQAETLVSEKEGENRLETLLAHNRRYVESAGKRLGFKILVQQLDNPDPEDLTETVSPDAEIFVDPENFVHPRDIANADVTLEDLTDIFQKRLIQVART